MATSSITIYLQALLLAHIYTPGLGNPYKLVVRSCNIHRGLGIVTSARVVCVLAYTTELGTPKKLQPKGYMVPAAEAGDKIQNKYITIGAMQVRTKLSGLQLHFLRPLFTGIITGVNTTAHMNTSGTSTELVIQCVAPIHKLRAQQLGGSWYYARALDLQSGVNQIARLRTNINNIKRSFAPQQANKPRDIVTLLLLQLATKNSGKSRVPLVLLLNQLHILVSRAAANSLLNPTAQTNWQPPLADRICSMLDVNTLVRIKDPGISSAADSTSWVKLWHDDLVRQLISCVAAGPFMSAIDMLIQDRFRMLDLAPIPLNLQLLVDYSYSAPAALMRIMPRTSILLRPINIQDTAKYMIDNILYTADYNGLLQRPDQLVVHASARGYSAMNKGKQGVTNDINAVPSTYFIYPKPLTQADATNTVRRMQILAPDWLNWYYIRLTYNDDKNMPAIVSPYALMLYAELYNTYGSLTLSGTVANLLDIPFDSALGSVIRFTKPLWTLPYLPNNTQVSIPAYTGRVLSLTLSYMAGTAGDRPSQLRYSATVRVVPDSVYDSHQDYISNKIYLVKYNNAGQGVE